MTDPIADWTKTHFTSEVVPALDGKKVTLMGWLRDVRLHGNLAFLVLADRTGDAQVTVLKKNAPSAFEKLSEITRESAIAVKGTVKKTDKTQRGVEVILEDLKLLNKSKTPLPLEVNEKVLAELDTRLDARVLDLRKPRISAIFKIRAQVLKSARDYLTENKFLEIETPKMIASATEGGTELFPIKYFEKKAFLRQSPQLYKELMVSCFEKVFEIGQVFRAEPSDTTQHLSEVTQLDIEMGFATEKDTWDVFDGILKRIYGDVAKNCAKELETLGVKFQQPKKVIVKTYTEILKELEKKGFKLKWGEDIPPEGERLICDIHKEPVVVSEMPMEQKPFYIHQHEKDPKLSYGFDLIFEGMELASGGRRIHDPEMYIAGLKAKGLNPKDFESVIKFYRYGMPPHAGWAIGIDRLVMVMCGLNNVREAVLFPRDAKRLTP
ncbi:MAG: aspartate--tRNA(Asn) ligase [archaeon]